MRKILKLVFIIPVAICILTIAVANRSPIMLSLDPVSVDPVFSFKAPLFVFLFLSLMIGILIGGFSVWMAQGVHRKTAKNLNKEVSSLYKETSKLKSEIYEAKAADTSVSTHVS